MTRKEIELKIKKLNEYYGIKDFKLLEFTKDEEWTYLTIRIGAHDHIRDVVMLTYRFDSLSSINGKITLGNLKLFEKLLMEEF